MSVHTSNVQRLATVGIQLTFTQKFTRQSNTEIMSAFFNRWQVISTKQFHQ